MTDEPSAEFLRAMPKAELHVHLEGSIRPRTLQAIDPALTLEEIDEHCRFDNFAGFIESYKWIAGRLTTADHYVLAVRALVEELAAQTVRHAEINLSAGVILWKNQSVEEIFRAVSRETRASAVSIRWIFDAVRQFGPDHALQVARIAARLRPDGVAGFGLGGDEACFESEAFRGAFDFARQEGLRISTHAGETTTAESVWGALSLGAERIGHGIRAVDDPALVKELRDRSIPLEISLSSNVATGAVASLGQHPLRRLYDAGVPVVLNTDDPALFHTTLTGEYEIAAKQFGFSRRELEEIAANGFRYAF